MKKIGLILILLYGMNLSASEFEDASEACNSGDMASCAYLGALYYTGEGVRQNKQKAIELFEQACDEGYDLGCKNYKMLNEAGY